MEIKLHIGCGPRILPGWVNADRIPVSDNVVYMDATRLLDADNTVDAIYSEDLFEHLSQQEQFEFLSECFRVLRPGCYCRVTCPELGYSLANVERLGGWPWDRGHVVEPTRRCLLTMARAAGLGQAWFSDRNDSISPLMPKDLRPHPPREDHGNLFVDLRKPRDGD